MARAHASARFVRVQSDTDGSVAARLVGATLSLPPMGRCESDSAAAEKGGMALAFLGPVDLVDVGEVSLEAGLTRATLAARVDLVSGVVYTTRDLVADPFPAPATYLLRIAGSATLAPLAIEAAAPSAPEELTIDGVPLGTERTEPLSILRADVALTWRPGSPDDTIYVDLASTGDGGGRVRCTFGDVGSAVIPQASLPFGAAQTIAVHRVHRQPLVAAGLDGGEMRFDLATTGAFRVESPTP